MDLGKAFVVKIPNSETEDKFIELIKERIDNYVILVGENTWQDDIADMEFPRDWLLSSRDGNCFYFEDGSNRIDGWGLEIRDAKSSDLDRIIEGQIPRMQYVN